jgi:hypothetical protein
LIMSTRNAVFVGLIALSLLLFSVFTVPSVAEDPKEATLAHIDKGREAFLADRGQEAIDHLQKAIGLIQQTAIQGLAGFLPEPPEGWKAREPQVNSGSFGAGEEAMQWSSASRIYTRESDSLRVEVNITSSPQIVGPQQAAIKMWQDPQMRKMLESDGTQKFEVVSRDGWEGISLVKEGSEATIRVFRAKTMLSIDVRKGDGAVLAEFFKGIDLAGLGAAVGSE